MATCLSAHMRRLQKRFLKGEINVLFNTLLANFEGSQWNLFFHVWLYSARPGADSEPTFGIMQIVTAGKLHALNPNNLGH